MSIETEQQYHYEEHPVLPGMEVINVIEGMSPEARIERKRRLLSEISDREKLCRMIDDVNAAEGINVELIG